MSGTISTNATQNRAESSPPPKKKPFYLTLWGQVLIGVALAIIYGYIKPASAVKMKPLGDGFIRLITMVITLIIFCTVVSGIAGMLFTLAPRSPSSVRRQEQLPSARL